MPGGDGTGPMGAGPMTGRAAGYCAGYGAPGYLNPVYGRGFGWGVGRGWGRGFGRGFGWRAAYPYANYPYYSNPYAAYPANVTSKQEVDALREQSRIIQNELNAINQRIKDIESNDNSKAGE